MAGNRLLPRPSSPRDLVGRRPRALPRANPPAGSGERGDLERDKGQPRLAGPHPRAREGPGQVIPDPRVAGAVGFSEPVDLPGIRTKSSLRLYNSLSIGEESSYRSRMPHRLTVTRCSRGTRDGHVRS